MIRLLATAVAVTLAIVCAQGAWAKPQHKQALVRYYGSYLNSSLRQCATCHVVPSGVAEPELADMDPEHNAFGARLRDLGEQLTSEGDTPDIVSRLIQAADEDADGDGFSNELELVIGTAPGDAASIPTAEQLAAAAVRREEFRTQYRWDSWQPVIRPAVPEITNHTWQRTPIDGFIAAEHQKRGLIARPEASRAVLLRRVYLDLIGLPPTSDELHAFMNDSSPDAYEKVVDSLLDRPEYGERWGRHWMDVWRYSDWAGWGEQVRDSMPHVWRWRDWMIESLNADKPYDRMIMEMLAADEYSPEDTDALRATGFLVRNYKRLSREQWMQDTVNHTTKAFLGATFECARCHDHMYDPISQEEYYRFRAIFEPYDVRTDRVPGEVNVEKNGLVRSYDANLSAETYLYIRGDDRQPDKNNKLTAGVPVSFEGPQFAEAEVIMPTLARTPDKRSFVIDDDLKRSAALMAEVREKRDQAKQQEGADPHQLEALELDALVAETAHESLAATVHVERLEEQGIQQSDAATWEQAAKQAVIAQRKAALAEKRKALFSGQEALAKAQAAKAESESKLAGQPEDQALKEAVENSSKALDEAQKNVTAAEQAVQTAQQDEAAEATTAYTKRNVTSYPEKSTGRRLALARWIADPRNPRTARVAVNHIWLRHFGQPLVSTMFDFGNNGQAPTHPALLDWLAAELMQPSLQSVTTPSGRVWQPTSDVAAAWSMKHLHRLIVTSSVYRMSSTPDQQSAQIDRDNQFLWRMPSRRMEAEVVRDCVLYVAGDLDLTRGGPDIDYEQGLTVKRRSMYFRHAPEKQMTFLRLFDAASPDECYRRKESIIPQQALALANSPLSLEQSRRIARKLQTDNAEPTQFVRSAFETVLSRPCTDDELNTCLAFLSEQQNLLAAKGQLLQVVAADSQDFARPSADPLLRARENLVHVLLNHNDFVTIR